MMIWYPLMNSKLVLKESWFGPSRSLSCIVYYTRTFNILPGLGTKLDKAKTYDLTFMYVVLMRNNMNNLWLQRTN